MTVAPEYSTVDYADVEQFFGVHWPANGGYYKTDGLVFKSCARCGIVMRLPSNDTTGNRVRKFCRDCNYPDLRGPLEAWWKW